MKKILVFLTVLLCITVISALHALCSPFEVFSFVSKPANNSLNNEAVVLKVTANVVTGATRYTIELNTSADFSGTSIIVTSAIDNQRTLVFKNLAYSTKYYARAITNISSAYGKITSFTTKAEAFSSLIDPVNATSGLDPIAIKVKPSFINWASHYTVQISTAPDFSNITTTLESRDNQEAMFLVRDLQYASTYYARVKTDVNTTFGPATSFSTRMRIPQSRLWGVTLEGGDFGRGTIFSFSIDSLKFTKHFDYALQDEYDEEQLMGSLVPAPGGGFYVMTKTVMSTTTTGSLYHYNPRSNYFSGVAGLGMRSGSFMLASDNFVYVTRNAFMSPADISKFSAPGVPQRIHWFGPLANGRDVEAPLTEFSNGYFYSTTKSGGINNNGVIYRMKHDGSAYEVIHHFKESTTGSLPLATLTDGHDGFLYGVALRGGVYNMGTVFKLRPDGSEFTVIHNFYDEYNVSPFGRGPAAEVIIKDGIIYGTTIGGGQGGAGTVYRLNRDGSNFSILLNFYSYVTTGATPIGSLVADDAGNLYGMTSSGGSSFMGIIYKVKIDGTGYGKLYDFSPWSGVRPGGSLVLTDDVYGTSPETSARKIAILSDQIETEDVVVSPNPFTNHININSKSKLTKVTVTDVNGRSLDTSYKFGDNLIRFENDLPMGVYILKMSDGKKVTIKRVVKSH